APVANDNGSLASPIAVTEDTPTSINVLANDTDVDGPGPLAIATVDGHSFALGVAFASADGHGMITVNANQNITFAPNANYNGPASFTYVAKEAGATPALSNTATVYLNVTPVNDAPV